MAKLLTNLIVLFLALAIPLQAMTVLAANLCHSTIGGSATAHHHAGAEGQPSSPAEDPADDPSCPSCDTCCAAGLISLSPASPMAPYAESAVPAAAAHSSPQSDPTPFFRPPRSS